ncbi:MAG: class I SAM-dependent methyltransferase [Acidimicrobiaceae bacterium]|nr:class I SAM-dependent methyltransferase [Acidimicrobiaceae bacterium]
MPTVTGTMLSAGPNGKWYFDWLDSTYGRVGRHIAVEAYVPRPDDLPSDVEWVEADIASPDGIGAVHDGEVDLLFSGQNIEHLWPDQVVAFLLEASRVIHRGGWLVIDSPNRELTKTYRWSMGEHTIEFTTPEAQKLLELAGFEVRSMRGLWLCRRNGELLPLTPTTLTELDTLERLALSGRHPEDSFIWWAESVKVAEPNEQALRDAVHDIYRQHFTERVSRLQLRDGAAMDDSGCMITIPKGTTGYPVVGPYMPLRDGTYQFKLPISWENCPEIGTTIVTFEVVVNDQCVASLPIVASASSGSKVATTEVDVQGPAFASHVRLLCSGSARIRVPLDLSIEPEPWLVAGG